MKILGVVTLLWTLLVTRFPSVMGQLRCQASDISFQLLSGYVYTNTDDIIKTMVKGSIHTINTQPSFSRTSLNVSMLLRCFNLVLVLAKIDTWIDNVSIKLISTTFCVLTIFSVSDRGVWPGRVPVWVQSRSELSERQLWDRAVCPLLLLRPRWDPADEIWQYFPEIFISF